GTVTGSGVGVGSVVAVGVRSSSEAGGGAASCGDDAPHEVRNSETRSTVAQTPARADAVRRVDGDAAASRMRSLSRNDPLAPPAYPRDRESGRVTGTPADGIRVGKNALHWRARIGSG